ncbi:MAG: CAP domain-containing protein [Gaiellaceae bacterium]
MKTPVTTALALLTCVGVLTLAAPSQAAPTSAERRLIAHINKARDARDMRRLRVGPGIQEGAHAWARHLRRADAFHHARLRAGTGEVIAWGTCSWFTPGRAVRAWLRSSGHRELVLRRGFRRVGAGWSRGTWRGYGCVEMAVVRFR